MYRHKFLQLITISLFFLSNADNTQPTPEKSLERRESTKLQSAAKLLRSLSKSRDLNKYNDIQDKANGVVGSLRRKRRNSACVKNEGDKSVTKKEGRSHSFHGKSDNKSARLRQESRLLSKIDNKVQLGHQRFQSCGDLIETQENGLKETVTEGHSYFTLDLQPACETSYDSSPTKGHVKDEAIVNGAKSILLTEDNLTRNQKGSDHGQDSPQR